MKLDDWFFAVKKQWAALEKACEAKVVRRVWFKGVGCPYYHLPWAMARQGIQVAVEVKAPRRPTSDHHLVGFDDHGQPVLWRQYTGPREHYPTFIINQPRLVRYVRFSAGEDDYWKVPDWVGEVVRDGRGRTQSHEQWSCDEMLPDRPLKRADIEKLKRSGDIEHWREKYHWDGDRLTSTDYRSIASAKWSCRFELTHDARGVARIARIDGKNRRIMWRRPRGSSGTR